MKKLLNLSLALLSLSTMLLMSSCTSSTTTSTTPLNPTKTKLSAPTNLKISGRTLTWDKVENASYYYVIISDTYSSTVKDASYTPNTASYTLSDSEIDKWITVTIEACPADNSETYSASETTSYVLAVPVNKSFLDKVSNIKVTVDSITKTGNTAATLTWDAVPNATDYSVIYYTIEVQADGSKRVTSSITKPRVTGTKSRVYFLSGKTYNIGVSAIPDATSKYIRSDYSEYSYTSASK